MFVSINPVDNALIKVYKSINLNDFYHKVEKAETFYKNKYFYTTIAERIEIVRRIQNFLAKNIEVYANLITQEMGKPIIESRNELAKCVLLCKYYIDSVHNFLRTESISFHGFEAEKVIQPIGGVLGIMPWNFPFWQVFRFAIPNILTGNVVFIKPAPNVSGCGLAIENLFKIASRSTSLFHTILIDVKDIPQVIAHPFIQGVSITGSERAGRVVGALAGEHLKKSVLELGGSDPFIVLDNRNMDRIVQAALDSRLNNNGQTCISSKRFIILETYFDEFVEKLNAKLQNYKIGNPTDLETQLGPIARRDLHKSLNVQIDESLKLGGEILGELKEIPKGDNYYAPKIISNIPENSPLYQEEVFGPIFSMYKVGSIAEAVKVANDSDYGLGACVWSSDNDLARQIALQLEVGVVALNDMVRSHPAAPFGGVKNSGYGRELGGEGLFEFANIKTILQ